MNKADRISLSIIMAFWMTAVVSGIVTAVFFAIRYFPKMYSDSPAAVHALGIFIFVVLVVAYFINRGFERDEREMKENRLKLVNANPPQPPPPPKRRSLRPQR